MRIFKQCLWNESSCHEYSCMKTLLTIMILGYLIETGCSNRHDYEIKNPDKYEKNKSSLEDFEKKDPVRFLTVTGKHKRNIVGQTVIRGNIYNNARMVHYKDVRIKLDFYSKTGSLLEEDQQVIYETINPGGSVGFKSKYFTPKGTDSVAMKVISAKF